jgi:hypothetical protein
MQEGVWSTSCEIFQPYQMPQLNCHPTYIWECMNMQGRHGQRYVLLCTVKSVYTTRGYEGKAWVQICSALQSEVFVQNVWICRAGMGRDMFCCAEWSLCTESERYQFVWFCEFYYFAISEHKNFASVPSPLIFQASCKWKCKGMR